MPDYSFWYTESYDYKGWFTADDMEHACELLDKVMEGELNIEQLPNWGNKDKGYEIELSPETLEEIEE